MPRLDKTITIRIPSSLRSRFRAACARHNIKADNWLRIAIEEETKWLEDKKPELIVTKAGSQTVG